jgi:hypothetical protein
VLTDDEQRKNMISKGYQYSLNFEDEKLAAQVMQLYQNLHNHA